MSVFDVILGRRSIRRYEDKEIPQAVLDKIVEAGRQSPSAVNKQPYRFVIVTDSGLKKELKSLFSRFLEKAPVVIVGCANTKALLTGKWATVDTAIALENMVLAAWSLGVGSCWIGSFNEQKTKELLKIPEDWKVVALVTFGYPAETPNPRKKKPVDELFGNNKF
ncbi:nitroreductase family protein [Candidatus Bathyarchaeota archaeon]|nr:nitroreductase family protein [Candidatus Bathyarchaeota archaeon]